MVTMQIYISGRVQGVGFRAFTRRQAERYPSLRGYVRNLSDGRVEVLVSGLAADLEALVRACRQGPPHSRVDGVEERELTEASPGWISHAELPKFTVR
ncbi:MAG: acylphosphatase [Bacteriovoracia bacterium]